MTDHPCKGMSKACRNAFERIAVNQPPQCTWAILDKLLAAGLIVKLPGEKRRDAMGVYEVPAFEVPTPLHMQWCQWCEENIDDEF